FLLNHYELVHQMIRPEYCAISQHSPTVQQDQEPAPDYRDPRIFREQKHDMRMPPYMRDELAGSLGLTRHQNLTLMTYVNAIAADAAAAQPSAAAVGESPGPATTLSRMPFRRRVQQRLQRIHAADQTTRSDRAGSFPPGPSRSER
ncbi:MAG: hypothetical protein ACRDRV_05970, partial [Pseudonocardiaceae bacterium]